MLLVETTQSLLTIILVVGGILWSIGGNDDGQHDEAEHEQKDDQVQHYQEAQEGEVRQDPCAKHPWMKGRQNGQLNNRNNNNKTTIGKLSVRAKVFLIILNI